MKQTSYLLKNGMIVNEGSRFQGDLIILGGVIDGIFPGGYQDSEAGHDFRVIDLQGSILMPGVIDDQVHFREPGLTHKADIYSESRAAVAGGITSYMEMPNTVPNTTTQDLLQKKFDIAAEKSLANYSFYMGATNDNLDELRATDPLNVCGVKVFMGASTGNMLVDNPATLENIFRQISLPVAVHCEDEMTVRKNLEVAKNIYGDPIPMFMHATIRSHEACERSSRLAIGLAEKFDTRLHLLHLSTANEVRLLNNDTPLHNKRITAEVCVHHLWFHIDDYAPKGSHIKWNPSIKYDDDRKALTEALKEGFADVIATDHAPHTLEEKKKSYVDCPSGAPMVQHALPAMFTLADKHNISFEKLVELMCHNPAICFNVKNRGFIREGYAADLVVVAPGKQTPVTRESLHYKCGWSPLEGSVLEATVEYTFVNGHLVYDNGRFDESQKGVALQFSR